MGESGVGHTQTAVGVENLSIMLYYADKNSLPKGRKVYMLGIFDKTFCDGPCQNCMFLVRCMLVTVRLYSRVLPRA